MLNFACQALAISASCSCLLFRGSSCEECSRLSVCNCEEDDSDVMSFALIRPQPREYIKRDVMKAPCGKKSNRAEIDMLKDPLCTGLRKVYVELKASQKRGQSIQLPASANKLFPVASKDLLERAVYHEATGIAKIVSSQSSGENPLCIAFQSFRLQAQYSAAGNMALCCLEKCQHSIPVVDNLQSVWVHTRPPSYLKALPADVVGSSLTG